MSVRISEKVFRLRRERMKDLLLNGYSEEITEHILRKQRTERKPEIGERLLKKGNSPVEHILRPFYCCSLLRPAHVSWTESIDGLGC